MSRRPLLSEGHRSGEVDGAGLLDGLEDGLDELEVAYALVGADGGRGKAGYP